MSRTVGRIFKQLAMDKDIIIPPGKLNALKDAIICAPEMMTKAFSTRTIQKAFVTSGMLDKKAKLCPDIHGIIQSFKVNWSNCEGGLDAFLNQVPEAILEFYKKREILESFYDERNFPIDSDLNGNQYILNSIISSI